MSFTHLHVHSEYSLLDGLARIEDLVRAAQERGFESLALTDHGVMYGAVRFYHEARKAGLRPLIGCELYVAPRTRFDRDGERDRKSHHLTVLAEDATGYRNLLELVSLAQLEGYYYRPRVDRELLERHRTGLIVLSGCPSGEAPRQILAGDPDGAAATLGWFAEVFRDRFFVEVQRHGIESSDTVTREIVPIARRLGLPLVATNDVHYARPQDVSAHEVLLCIQTATNIHDPKRMRYGNSFYLRTEQEMRETFADLPEAVDNTARVAEMCNVRLDFEGYRLPRFDVPHGRTAAAYLRELCEAGVVERYGRVSPGVRERLDYETAVISQMGFDDYFLIVWDLCRHARECGVWWNVRGSGAGSIVAYALRITNLDPLAHGLIFERFLNPSRVSMPDIDLDFPDDQRDDLIRYAFAKYGRDRVAQIITFGTMGARAAIRDTGRALDMGLPEVDRVARLMPAVPGKACGIEDALRPPSEQEPNEFYAPDLARLYEQDEDVRRLLDTARSLEGVARHASTHAAGVVICDRPLVEVLPLHRPTHGNGDDADAGVLPVTQFDMTDVERLGLLKVDFLGLATLTVLRRATDLIERTHGTRFTLDNIPLDDPDIYALLASGDVTGVFQVESSGMRRMLREMQPQRFEHVVAAIALYRPGPMEQIPHYIARLHGREAIAYRHPALEPILAETYGIIVYQEQIIRIARDLAGYNAGEADTIRKAVSKKNKEELLRHRAKFVSGATANGIPEAVADGIFDDIEFFARYGFNKAHAADYAVIVCQTAFLKARYPVEYLAALLSVDRDDTERIALIAADCRRMGVRLLGPDINASDLDFVIEPLDEAAAAECGAAHDRAIRFGLAAVKNVGIGPVTSILDARRDGRFRDLEDLGRRVDLRVVGKRALESLVRVGALDAFGARARVLAALDHIVGFSSAHHQAAEVGQLSLFGGAAAAPEPGLLVLPSAAGDPRAELQWEKELVGLYLTEHPLHRVAEHVRGRVTAMLADVDAQMAGQQVTLVGMASAVRRVTTKKGDTMAFARLEDLQGSVEVTLFPRIFDATRAVWVDDNLVLVRGRVELRDERLQVIVESAEAYAPDLTADSPAVGATAPVAPEATGAPECEDGAATAETLAPGAPARGTEAYLGPAYHLYVTVPRTGDDTRDVQLLAEVYHTLGRHRGSDAFSLYVPGGSGTVELEFPNTRTRYCVALMQEIEQIVGPGRTQVQAVPRPA